MKIINWGINLAVLAACAVLVFGMCLTMRIWIADGPGATRAGGIFFGLAYGFVCIIHFTLDGYKHALQAQVRLAKRRSFEIECDKSPYLWSAIKFNWAHLYADLSGFTNAGRDQTEDQAELAELLNILPSHCSMNEHAIKLMTQIVRRSARIGMQWEAECHES